MPVDKAHSQAVRASTKVIMDYAARELDANKDRKLDETELTPLAETIMDTFHGRGDAASGGGPLGPEKMRIQLALFESLRALPDEVKAKTPGSVRLSDLRIAVRKHVDENLTAVKKSVDMDGAMDAMMRLTMLPDVAVKHLQDTLAPNDD